jgi:hypothetical protein
MTKRRIVTVVVCGILCVCFGTNLIPTIQGDALIRERSVKNDQWTSMMTDENSVICGYVIDNETGDPIENVDVDFYWEDPEGNNGENSTFTDAEGFYHFHTAPVDFVLIFTHDSYFQRFHFELTIGENEIFWFNISLIPIPEQTVLIQGYITDNTSGEPVEGATIFIYWDDYEGHYWENNTVSGTSGYYSLAAIPGRTQIFVEYLFHYFTSSTEIFTENNSITWLNISLVPYPPITALVCGYIKDAELGDPIPDAYARLYCDTESGNFYNYTLTNEVGFYSVGTIPGNLFINAYKDDYTTSWSTNYDIVENQTLWINLTLTYQPAENSRIQGFVVDNETHATIRNAYIRYDWKDDAGHFYSKSTFTNQKGYYSIMAPAGAVQFSITETGYTRKQTPWIFIQEDSEQWFNTTLTPEISVEFIKPKPGVYINNETRFPIFSKLLLRLFPKSMPLIIGPLEITVNITKSTLGCNRVEFYIDSIYCGTDLQAPFTYYWNQSGFLIQKHEIQVIAYDNAGPCTIETVMVRKVS